MDTLERYPLADGAVLPIPDLNKISIDDLFGAGVSTPLANAMRRCLPAVLRPGQSYAAHSSTP